MKKKYFIEIMKKSTAKNGVPLTKIGKIDIHPSSEGYVHQVFANAGWIVTNLVPMSYNKVKEVTV
jgi:hypothetical protein